MPGTNTVPGITYERNIMNWENNTYIYILIFVAGCIAIFGGHYL